MVPLGAQGVLYGGNNVESFQSVSEVLFDSGDNLKTVPKFSWEKSIQVRWLDPSYEGTSKVQSVLDEYELGSEKEFLQGKKLRMQKFQLTQYVGAKSCQPCHQKEYEIWRGSDHHAAVPTLKKENKHRDTSCIGCHVVGWEKGGYVDMKETKHLAGVQCENCHGAGKKHVESLSKFSKNPKSACGECHHGQHSPEFEFDGYWKKIQHGQK